jgi:hypothetical protein
MTTCMGFGVLVVVSTKTAAFWDVILCSVVCMYNCLEGNLCHQGLVKELLHSSQCSYIPIVQYE